MEIKNKKISLRVKSYYFERLDYLQALLKCNRSEIIRLAITELYAREYCKREGREDEDSKGYAGEDNDLISRLELNGLKHHKTKAKAVHLFHGSRCDSKVHYDNPLWKLNFDLFSKRKGIIIRNQGREWGVIK